MKKKNIVSILGCGWVGKVLAKSLRQTYHVHCLSRDIEENQRKQMYTCDTLVIAIPPSTTAYMEVLEQTVHRLDEINFPQVIFLSSISFYDAKASVVEAERLMQTLVDEVVILRLSGLMGYDRVAGKYTAGKVLTADSRTNYVHRDDVVGIIKSIMRQKVVGEVFDVVAPIQSTKKEIFSQNAKRFGFNQTEFLNGDMVGKELSPLKLIKTLEYSFQKPDVKMFWD